MQGPNCCQKLKEFALQQDRPSPAVVFVPLFTCMCRCSGKPSPGAGTQLLSEAAVLTSSLHPNACHDITMSSSLPADHGHDLIIVYSCAHMLLASYSQVSDHLQPRQDVWCIAWFGGHAISCCPRLMLWSYLLAAGKIEGDVRVSGHPKVQATFARVMGYVEQTDIHSPNVSPCSLFKRPAVLLLHTQSASCADWLCYSASKPVPCCCLELV